MILARMRLRLDESAQLYVCVFVLLKCILLFSERAEMYDMYICKCLFAFIPD